MSFRVQFTITDKEKLELENAANKEGYPNIAAFCKSRALGKKDYADLYKEMVANIVDLKPETDFYLRDVLQCPPALIGKWLYENVQNGKIPDVEALDKDGADAVKYRKHKKEEHTMIDRNSMIERLKEAEENHTYAFYGSTDFDEIEDETIIDLYANMMNYLSDARTYIDW